MELDQILASIRDNYSNPDIQMLVEKMAAGQYSVRKQLADMVCARPAPAKMAPLMIHEIAKWGITDDLSKCPEIRALKK